jgi:hypothetical protein
VLHLRLHRSHDDAFTTPQVLAYTVFASLNCSGSQPCRWRRMVRFAWSAATATPSLLKSRRACALWCVCVHVERELACLLCLLAPKPSVLGCCAFRGLCGAYTAGSGGAGRRGCQHSGKVRVGLPCLRCFHVAFVLLRGQAVAHGVHDIVSVCLCL